MKILILNTDYGPFLEWLYAKNPGLQRRSYDEQLRVRNESLFGVADFYSSNLNKLGHEAREIHLNNEPMQAAWAREHDAHLGPRREWHFRLRRGLVPWISRRRREAWFFGCLAAQIRHYQPDVVLNQAIDWVPAEVARGWKEQARLVAGQIAAPLPQNYDFKAYDLIVSSLPNLVEKFRSMGVPSELNRLAFEPEIVARLGERKPSVEASFVGSLFPAHTGRVALLETLCQRTNLQVWTDSVSGLSEPIRSRHQGAAWGIEMYQVLRKSKLTVNHHIATAESYANNLRLFEATGAGTLLVTDWKQNLTELFEPGKEVVVYRSPGECVEAVRHYQEHHEARERIARAGQERTLRDHNYPVRMRELTEILQKHLRAR